MLIKILFGIFSCFIVDVKRFNFREDFTSLSTGQYVYARELGTYKKRQSEKKKVSLYKKGKWQKKKSYQIKTHAYQSVRPRDVRFTNQQKLRRMYRNC